jgi:hypothetical protein
MLFWPEASSGQNSVAAMPASASDPTLEFLTQPLDGNP